MCIRDRVDDIKNLVNEFSSFARMPKVNLYLGDVNKVVSTQLSLFKTVNKNIEWSYINNLPKDYKMMIDAQQLRQALTNIFQNSVDSIYESPSNNKGLIKVLTELKKAKVLLIIEDNGPGFPKNRESLTNPYVTLRDKGTGLGLSIVSRIIEEHNGKLILEDSKLGGAKILIEFPV